MADEDPFVPSLPVGDNTGGITEPVGEVLSPQQRSRKNLKPPWAKGMTGNSKGRPRTKVFELALHKYTAQRAPESMLANLPKDMAAKIGKRPIMAEVLMYRAVMMAAAGDFQVLKWLVERAEGRNPFIVNEGDQGSLQNVIQAILLAPKAPGEVNDDADDGPVL